MKSCERSATRLALNPVSVLEAKDENAFAVVTEVVEVRI